jgi:hypothetical protein
LIPSAFVALSCQGSLDRTVVLTVVSWGGGYAWQVRYTREDVDPKTTNFKGWDWTTKGYVGPMFLYFFYGMYDAAWQGIVYW